LFEITIFSMGSKQRR